MDPAPSAVGGVQLPASAAQGMMAPRRWYDLEMQSNKSEYEEIVRPKRQKGAARLTSTERRSKGKRPAKCQRGRQTREQLKRRSSSPSAKRSSKAHHTSTGRRIRGRCPAQAGEGRASHRRAKKRYRSTRRTLKRRKDPPQAHLGAPTPDSVAQSHNLKRQCLSKGLPS